MIFAAIEDPRVAKPANYIVYCAQGVIRTCLTPAEAGALIKGLSHRNAQRSSELMAMRAIPLPAHLATKAKLRLKNKEAEYNSGPARG